MNLIKNSLKFSFASICWAPTIITQIALQLISAHSYGGTGTVGRNEEDENLKSLGDVLGDIIGRVISVRISNNVPADLNTSIHVLRKLLLQILKSIT